MKNNLILTFVVKNGIGKLLAYLVIIFISNSALADNAGLSPSELLVKKLSDVEKMITCSATYQENKKINEYVKCVDNLIKDRLINNKKMGFAIQIFVTANDAKANDIVNDYNKKPLIKTKAISIPFVISYPGGAKLNDGKYYKILVVDKDDEFYRTEDAAREALDSMQLYYPEIHAKAFITQIPYMVNPST